MSNTLGKYSKLGCILFVLLAYIEARLSLTFPVPLLAASAILDAVLAVILFFLWGFNRRSE